MEKRISVLKSTGAIARQRGEVYADVRGDMTVYVSNTEYDGAWAQIWIKHVVTAGCGHEC